MDANPPVLLVEDDKVDAMTVKRAFRDLNISNNLIIVDNGIEALNYLRDDNNTKPCMILLDINMPKMNGIEFLKISKEDDILKCIPVVVVTTSREDRDRIDMFNLSVSGYMIKPIEYKSYLNTIRTIESYWSLSKFPPMYQ
jgi:CheY-like chemotaxis protein